MMKSSMCTIGFQKNKWGRDRSVEIPLREILPILSEAGLDGVEIWIDHLAALDDKGREQALRQLQQLKLGVAMISPYFDFTTSDDRDTMASLTVLPCLIVLRGLSGSPSTFSFHCAVAMLSARIASSIEVTNSTVCSATKGVVFGFGRLGISAGGSTGSAGG